MPSVIVAILLTCLVLVSDACAQQADRVALVIGNSKYEGSGVLRNPANDADAIEAALTPLGFKVIKKKDLDLAGMEDAIVAFRRSLTKGSVGLFFYAGHGMQVKGENFLVPVGAHMREEFEVKRQCLQLATVLDAMAESESNLKIVVLDCCRDDPFKRSWSRSAAGGGLAALSNVPEGTVIAFATSPDKTAADGTGKNSPYTESLVNVLKSRPAAGLELRDVFFDASRAVKRQTGQIPWLNMEASLEKYYLWQSNGATVAKTMASGTVKPADPAMPAEPTIPAKPTDSASKYQGLIWAINRTCFAIRFGKLVRPEPPREMAKQLSDSEKAMWKQFSRDWPGIVDVQAFIASGRAAPGPALESLKQLHAEMEKRQQRMIDGRARTEILKKAEVNTLVLFGFDTPESLAAAILSCVEGGLDCIVIPDDSAMLPKVVTRFRSQKQLSRLFATGKIVWILPEQNGSGYEGFFQAAEGRYLKSGDTILRYLELKEYLPLISNLQVVFDTTPSPPSSGTGKKLSVLPPELFK